MPKLTRYQSNALASLALVVYLTTAVSAVFSPLTAQAAPISVTGGLNVTATVLPTAPTTQAVITQPVTNTRVQTTPLVLQGTCGPDLLVRVFNNGILAGSITCSPQGDFVMNITLELGENLLTSFNYDSFEQAGPQAPAVTVIVEEPVAAELIEDSDQTVIEEDGTIAVEAEAPATASNDYQRLFEGTIVEPLAKALDVSAVVTPRVNTTVAVAVNSVFILAIFGLLAILLL